MTAPVTVRPGIGTSRITDSDNMDLPHPLSPTMPRVRPRATDSVTPSTAGTGAASLPKTVRRPSIESNGAVTAPVCAAPALASSSKHGSSVQSGRADNKRSGIRRRNSLHPPNP